jgi:hypothetical protein
MGVRILVADMNLYETQSFLYIIVLPYGAVQIISCTSKQPKKSFFLNIIEIQTCNLFVNLNIVALFHCSKRVECITQRTL